MSDSSSSAAPHAVVTGASSGIGETLARHLAREGYALTLVARRRERLEALAEELAPTPVHVVTADLSDSAHCADWLPAAEEALGPVALLVNNAGLQVIGPTGGLDVDHAEASLRLNLATPMRLWTAVLPGMQARGRGAIVDICSAAALTPTPGMAWYNASKGGLAAASEALHHELRGTGVHVLTVYPGIIASTALARAGIASFQDSVWLRMQPAATEDGLARRILTALRRRRPRVVYPGLLGFTRWFAPIARWFVGRFSPPLR
ncbi:MAG: SDR family NAD(P)-dependent oxidoreductase [Alphaproteobacteria bacterium]|nr:SDR family NAD(P)-dependent oxidoreductase [Alphaproteobacteria bacterium]